MSVEKNRIRLLFYTCTIIVILTLVTSLNIMYLRYLTSETEVQLQTLESGIIEMKKSYLKNIVDSMIQTIQLERNITINEEIEDLNCLLTELQKIIIEDKNLQDITNYIKSNHLIYDHNLEFILYDNDQNTIELNSSKLEDMEPMNKEQIMGIYTDNLIHGHIKSSRYTFIYTINDDVLHQIIRTAIKYKVSNLRFLDNGYIWINEILDYSGGDQYAIRFVHPNLPDTEGLFLSTNTVDSQGNYPYKIELDGINERGELYFEYYFKKIEENMVAHKMSYAKLYKPYNWVVATGVYLDDVDLLIKEESEDVLISQESLKIKAFLLTAIAVIFSISIIMLFEGKITKLILRFQKRLEEKNRVIAKEKELIEKIAYLDPLTSIFNRRAITDRLEEQLNKSTRHKETFTIAILDIDNFKLINDTYGHEAGDLVIQSLSTILKENIRKEDAVGRWGGEEFMLLLDRSNIDNARDKFNNIIKLINKDVIKYNGHIIGFSVTLGSYTFDNSVLSLDEMIKIADDNLYEGKKNGKNQIVCS